MGTRSGTMAGCNVDEMSSPDPRSCDLIPGCSINQRVSGNISKCVLRKIKAKDRLRHRDSPQEIHRPHSRVGNGVAKCFICLLMHYTHQASLPCVARHRDGQIPQLRCFDRFKPQVNFGIASRICIRDTVSCAVSRP